MQKYREIVTKAVIGKGKKVFTDTKTVKPSNIPSTILGCWVINHNFSGQEINNQIVIDGSYDVNIWYSYDNNTKTDVIKSTNSYHEVVNMILEEEVDNKEIIVRSLKQPNCTNVEIVDDSITYTIDKELGVELVGDIFVHVADSSEDIEDNWSEIIEESKVDQQEIDKQIEEEVKEEFIDDKEIM